MDAGHIAPGRIDDRSIVDLSPAISWGMTASTCSPASAAGITPLLSLDGLGDRPGSGLAPALASPSAAQARAEVSRTIGISGPRWPVSSASARLQSSLASRLKARLDGRGSTLFLLTWKEQATPAGRRFSLLRASARRTSDTERTGLQGWPTPTTRDWKDGGNPDVNVPLNALLGRVAWLAGWPTPQARDDKKRLGRTSLAGSEPSRIESERLRAVGGPADAGEERRFEHPQCDSQSIAGTGSPFRNDVGGCSGFDPWADVEWLPCRDGKYRPTQSGLFPLAHGAAARVGKLRAYGNAIVPQAAAEFIQAALDSIELVT